MHFVSSRAYTGGSDCQSVTVVPRRGWRGRVKHKSRIESNIYYLYVLYIHYVIGRRFIHSLADYLPVQVSNSAPPPHHFFAPSIGVQN